MKSKSMSSGLALGIAVLVCVAVMFVPHAFSADCMTKMAQGPCSLPQDPGSCNQGSDCSVETEPNVTSPECGTTGYEKTPYSVCVAACPHVVNCEQAQTQYSFGKIYYCYCLDDWGWDGTCTINIVNTCFNYPYVSRGPC